DGSGQTYYLAYDPVGSLRIVADASGNVVKQIDYDTFGNIIADTAPLFDIPFGFAGGLHGRDTGLVRFGFRDYDPDSGRWTAKDPIGFAGGDTDLYGYCLNDPVNLSDPKGLWEPQAIGAAFGLGFEAYRQYQSGKFNGGRLLMATAMGALGGFGNTLGKAMFFGATANIVNAAYQQTSDPCASSLNVGQLAMSGAYGLAGGFMGYGGGTIGKNS
ncbi:MAG: RHS repeat-associated core domain-containing protein, partial [Desulfococcaceae bacterium]